MYIINFRRKQIIIIYINVQRVNNDIFIIFMEHDGNCNHKHSNILNRFAFDTSDLLNLYTKL